MQYGCCAGNAPQPQRRIRLFFAQDRAATNSECSCWRADRPAIVNSTTTYTTDRSVKCDNHAYKCRPMSGDKHAQWRLHAPHAKSTLRSHSNHTPTD
eukprot:15168396-Alexandrium_andersonii.AAC.1